MIKNVLTEEITRINNIIHGNKLLTESAIASNIIKDAIIQSIKSVIDDTVSKAILNKRSIGTGKTMLIDLIKTNTSNAVFRHATGSGRGVGEVFKDILAKTVNS